MRLALLGAVLVAALVGCGGPDNGPPPPAAPAQADQDKAIAEIENNPSMSPEAKQQAIAGYKSGVSRMGTRSSK